MSSLLRSTKFVRYFTGAARTLILNTAKTAEVNTLINPKALCAFNNVTVRDYATSKKPESLEPLLQKLDLEVRRYGRITKRDIDEVFDEMRTSHDITSSQSLLIIRCCGDLVPEELPEQRTLLVQKIWSVLTERGVPMDISHYNALLRVYLENEHPFSPAKFLEELEKKGLQPNRVTYQRLMWRYCQEGDVDGATKVLEKMRELNMPVSEPVLNALVMGHAFHGDTEGAKAVLETMAGAGLEPTNHTYALLACGYAKQGDIEGVEKTIKMAEDKDIIMTDKDILDIIEHMTLGGHGDQVEKLFHHLKKGAGYNQDVCNLIFKLLNKGHEDTAKKIMKTMPKSPNVEDTMFKGAFFIKQLLKLNKPHDAVIKSCLELKKEDLVPNAIFIATEVALQQGQVELAQELFKELKKEGKEIRQHYFWPLLAQKGKEGDEEGLLQILRNMIMEGHNPSGETLRDYVLPYLMGKDSISNILLKLQISNVPIVHAARNLLIELLESGKIKEAATLAVQYHPRGQYSLLMRPLLNALTKTKDIESFATILQVISINPLTLQNEEDSANNEDVQYDDVQEVGRIVRSAVKVLNDPKLSEKLLQACLAKGVRISTESANEIQQRFGEHMTTNLSELLSRLTSADLETVPIESPKRPGIPRNPLELEQLYNRLKNRPNSNVNRIQKQLLTAYVRENNKEKVESFLKELQATNFELNLSTLSQLFEFYCQNDQIEKANEIGAQIHKKDPEFRLSKLKIVQMAYALVRANKFDEAIKYLKENKFSDEGEQQPFAYNSKCWQMLNTLAEQKDDVKVKEMTKALIENNYIAPSNVILGPLIKVHLLKDDLDTALKEFEECCKTYRSTPWKGELMKALIMKEDATRLQWLADLSTQIHGEVNILHDLVLAFVECGRLRQARRILETPGLLARHRRLDDACQRYVQEGKSEYLEGLLEATKELSHIDRSNIFYHLLVTYCKANETDKALGLWTILQEEGEIPSDQFLNYLAAHLKSKNREVPFVIPDEKLAAKSAPKPATTSTPQQTVKQKQADTQDSLTKRVVSDKINDLIDKGKPAEAMDFVIQSIKRGVFPKSPVLKYLLKTLAEKGNVEKIKQLESHLTEDQKREVTYDDKLTSAVFARGEGQQHTEKLLQTVTTASSDTQLQEALKGFPRSLALSHVMQNQEIIKNCQKIAEIAASKGYVMPANILWMEFLIVGRDSDADSLYKQWLKDADRLLFRRLSQEAHVKKQPQLIEKLISALKSNQKISQASLATVYSRLINLYLMDDRTSDAVTTYENAVKLGIPSSNFYKNTLERLKAAAETQGKQLNI